MRNQNWMLAGLLGLVWLAACTGGGSSTPADGTQNRSIPTATAIPQVMQACLMVEGGTVELATISSGTLLQIEPPAMLDVHSGQQYPLPARPAPPLDRYRDQVSPDGSKFAFLEITQNKIFQTLDSSLWIVDARGKTLARLSFGRRAVASPRWLDDQRLLLLTDQTYRDGSVLLVDPFTGELQGAGSALPDFATKSVPAGVSWRAEYAPDLRWVAYLGTDGTILRDLPAGRTVWAGPQSRYDSKPVWAPDGQSVAIADGGLNLVTRAGQVKTILAGGPPDAVQDPVWSPDGGQLAFWNGGRLMIFDRSSSQARDVCILAGSTGVLPAAWSPDGRQLAVFGYPQDNANHQARALLLDLRRDLVYTNVEALAGLNPAVWLAAIPH